MTAPLRHYEFAVIGAGSTECAAATPRLPVGTLRTGSDSAGQLAASEAA